MKKILLAIMLTLVTGTTTVSLAASGPKHRYQPGIEAFSDTTSNDTAVSDAAYDEDVAGDDDDDSKSYSVYSPSRYSDPFDYFGNLFGKGAVVVIIILCVLLGLMFIFAPFIIIFLIIRYCMRRHDDNVRLAEKAMENGQPIPDEMKNFGRQGNEYLVKRGLRNAFFGAGLCVMFSIWGADFLAGIGALVFFYGAGQTVIGALPSIKDFLKNRRGQSEQ